MTASEIVSRHPNGATYTMSREMLEIWSEEGPRDPKWRWHDAAGHVHVWFDAEMTMPTAARWHADVRVCGLCVDNEPYDHGWWECTLCGEAIGTSSMNKPGPWCDLIPGMVSVTAETRDAKYAWRSDDEFDLAHPPPFTDARWDCVTRVLR